MKCISVMSIPRPGGRGSTDRISVPCGRCPACLQNKRVNWSFRLQQELRMAKTAKFVTLTYNDDNSNGSLSKIDVQLFLKRFRALCKKVDGWDHMRYFITGEYGKKTNRPHYHALLFDIPFVNEMELYGLINKSWKKGSTFIGNVSEASIMYTAKYMLKGSYVPDGCEEPFSLMSRKPGIGFNYVERMADWHTETGNMFAVKEGGEKVNLPRYYKDKIFSKTDKEEKSEKLKNEIDRIDNERLFDTFAKGENPFVKELAQKKDLERKIKNVIKRGSL